MPSEQLDMRVIPAPLRQGLQELQHRLDLPREFPGEVLAEAEAAASLDLGAHLDLTEIEFVTIDPAASQDLDQAIQIERDGAGYLVRYAIADVGHFVRHGTAIERETHRRGQTMYAPEAKVALHPKVLSEGIASLLADGQPRPAMVWQHRLDASGELVETSLTRALVLSRAKFSYEGVQADLKTGRIHPSIALLPEVGAARERIEIDRGGISLNLPEQEIVERGGTWGIELRRMTPVERHNAQISLLTGFAAAHTMVQGKIGILRRMPPAEDSALLKLRRATHTLGVEWPQGQSYPDFVRSLRCDHPAELAALTKCTALFRGADYISFDTELPDGNLIHGALVAHYAHTTAPLRRLVDRYVLEICHSLLNGLPVPQWVRADLALLPAELARSARLAKAYERGVLDLVEALVVSNRIGDVLHGVVTDVHPKSGQATVLVAELALELRVAATSDLVGVEVALRIDDVDLVAGRVLCSLV